MQDTVKDRLLQFIANKGIGQAKFEKICGLSNGYINNIKNTPSVLLLQKMVYAFPDLDLEWLVLGNAASGTPTERNVLSDKDGTSVINPDVVMVPVYNLDARGGFGENDEIAPEYVTEHMPFSRSIARDGDVVIPIYSDSMTPKFPAGSFVLIRNIQMWREYIEYGASYVLEFMDGRRVIKNIQRSKEKNNFLLESVNPKYEPMDIPKNTIRRVFQVLMSVKSETL